MRQNSSEAEGFAWFNSYMYKLNEIEVSLYQRLVNYFRIVASNILGRWWQEFPGEYVENGKKYKRMSLDELEELAPR